MPCSVSKTSIQFPKLGQDIKKYSTDDNQNIAEPRRYPGSAIDEDLTQDNAIAEWISFIPGPGLESLFYGPQKLPRHKSLQRDDRTGVLSVRPSAEVLVNLNNHGRLESSCQFRFVRFLHTG